MDRTLDVASVFESAKEFSSTELSLLESSPLVKVDEHVAFPFLVPSPPRPMNFTSNNSQAVASKSPSASAPIPPLGPAPAPAQEALPLPLPRTKATEPGPTEADARPPSPARPLSDAHEAMPDRAPTADASAAVSTPREPLRPATVQNTTAGAALGPSGPPVVGARRPRPEDAEPEAPASAAAPKPVPTPSATATPLVDDAVAFRPRKVVILNSPFPDAPVSHNPAAAELQRKKSAEERHWQAWA